MTTLRWDHIVHYVNDLEKPIQVFADNGLIAFRGGSHKLWGTFNALSYFGLTYLEFLAIEDRELASSIQEPNRVVKDAVTTLPDHEALSRVAIRTDNIDDTVERLKANGLSLSPIMAGKRLDARGEWIEWKMVTIDGDFQGLVYPFVIQWKGSDEERLKNLSNTGVIQPHPAGSVTLKSARFTVSDPAAVAKHWQQLFDLPKAESADEDSEALMIGDYQFIFTQGEVNQLTHIFFHTNSEKLAGKIMEIGEGKYVFSAQ
ncbi:VOC family protein [Neobacillus muris]|uniref:VOC family protein n=1 Tax=Neobacillus muris TaxID=2941334 RepID=UPI0020421A39|nr:VOC family protein [Neobacillus muris]